MGKRERHEGGAETGRAERKKRKGDHGRAQRAEMALERAAQLGREAVAAEPEVAEPETTALAAPPSPAEGAAEASADADRHDGAGGAAEADASGDKPRDGKAAPVLPWMRVPVAIEASDGIPLKEVHGMDARLRSALKGNGIEALFPVQTVVWHEMAGGASAAHDVCICAPTGSGKTLAYSLPVLQELAGRAVPRLRALIVLPTRDLAVQVFAVLASLCPALGLRACLAAGRAGLGAEAAALAGGGVDVVVATPGRLIAHLEGTPGFTLEHLRFLVVDETDRLLRQAYHGWLPKVMAALEGGCLSAGLRSGAAPAGGTDGASGGSGPLEAAAAAPRRVVKLVVSATLTRDPSKIDRLGLHCPRYIAMSAVDHRHKLPRSLREFKLVAPAEHKPLALAALLARLGPQPTIVFAGSVEAAHRLHLLLSACAGLPGAAVEFSSLLRPEQRRASLEAFRSGAAQVLVCSDAMTRGMDVAGVACVINYDAPVYVKTYVHRAGRTARAGRAGAVYTLLRHEDVRHFKDMLRKADNTYVKDVKLERAELDAVRPAVAAALDAMQGVLAAEVEAAAAVAAARAAGQREAGGQGAGGGGGGAAQAVGQAAAGEGEAPAAAHRKHKRRRLAGVQELVL